MIVPVSPSHRPSDAPNKVRQRKAAKHTRKLQRRIERALELGNDGAARFYLARYLGSFDARLTAAIHANRRLPKHRRVHKTRLLTLARAANPWLGTNEPVTVHARAKADVGFRPIHDYGPQARTLQQLLKAGLRSFAQLDPRQFGTSNGGREAAVRSIKEGVVEQELKWFLRLDIRSFYQSIDETKIIDFVPAPREVSVNIVGPPRNVVLGQSSTIRSSTLLSASQRGLSQGASSSPIIADMIVASILGQIPADAFVINVADDFAIMARTKREVVALKEALTSAVRRCPHGNLQLIAKSPIRRVSDGFSFLGYDFRYRRLRLKCEPSRSNQTKFLVRVGCILRRMSAEPMEHAKTLQRVIKSWRNAFSQWDAGPDMLGPRLWVVQLSSRFHPVARNAVNEALGPGWVS